MSAYTGIVLFNYRLTHELGEGGFGVVYEAIHEQLGRRCAVKILHPAFARHDEVVARFFREAQAACAVGHRAIVDITNYGRLDTGEPFIMMDFVAGRSLAALTAQDGPLPLERLVDTMGPVASALVAAHTKGVVHRDLKPDNIMVAVEDGVVADVKLLDFGIAKLTDAKSNDVSTRAGSVMGTPNYMAPEQATDAKSVDGRADVYSFAATVYAALTGRPPFEAESTTALLLQVTMQPAPRLRASRPDAPPALDDVLAACMEKDPARRPPTIDAAWRAMRSALGGPVSTAQAAVAAASPAVAGASQSFPKPAAPHQTTLSGASGQTIRGARSRRLGLGLAAVGAVGLVVAIVVLAGGGTSSSTPATELGAVAAGEVVPVEERVDRGELLDPTADPVVAPAVEPIDAVAAAPLDAAEALAPPADAPVVAPPVDAAATPKVVRTERRPECARSALERVIARASASQRTELKRRVESCASDGGLGRRDRDRLLASIQKLGATTVATGKGSGTAGPVTPPPPPPPPPDELVCTKPSFAAVYSSRAPSKDAARKALQRLGKCESDHKISAGDARTARSALTAIVLSQ